MLCGTQHIHDWRTYTVGSKLLHQSYIHSHKNSWSWTYPSMWRTSSQIRGCLDFSLQTCQSVKNENPAKNIIIEFHKESSGVRWRQQLTKKKKKKSMPEVQELHLMQGEWPSHNLNEQKHRIFLHQLIPVDLNNVYQGMKDRKWKKKTTLK